MQHPVPLGFKGFIAYDMGPDSRPHGFAQQVHPPDSLGSRVFAVPMQEGCLQARGLLPLLDRQPAEICGCGTKVEAAEVNCLYRAVIAKPVPGLPVPMCGNNIYWLRPVLGQPTADFLFHSRFNAMLFVQPVYGFCCFAELVVFVDSSFLGVQCLE